MNRRTSVSNDLAPRGDADEDADARLAVCIA